MDATAYASFYAFTALIIFLGLMVYLKVPGKLMGALDDRSQKIRGELDEAARLRQEAQALLTEYQGKTRNAEAEAAAIIAEAKAEAERFTAETRKALEEMIARRTRAAEAKIAQAEAQAVAEVRAKAADVAIAAAGSILAQKMRGPAADDLIMGAIADVRAKLN
ncbi:F0F1 ATP synthase subunit B family protein [Prosthecomicrobium sp. N25]|uniref:F0F1 ATP synthase subunit B family protein n=1 Tax=Prosthecomicrobium sp. N25 TaxID=3129254 RepID=UPI003077E671